MEKVEIKHNEEAETKKIQEWLRIVDKPLCKKEADDKKVELEKD